jgi:hypothetical protein
VWWQRVEDGRSGTETSAGARQPPICTCNIERKQNHERTANCPACLAWCHLCRLRIPLSTACPLRPSAFCVLRVLITPDLNAKPCPLSPSAEPGSQDRVAVIQAFEAALIKANASQCGYSRDPSRKQH